MAEVSPTVILTEAETSGKMLAINGLPEQYRRNPRLARAVVYLGGAVILFGMPVVGLVDSFVAAVTTGTTGLLLYLYGQAWGQAIRQWDLLEAATPGRETILDAVDEFDEPPTTTQLADAVETSERLVRYRLRTMLHDDTLQNQQVGEEWVWSRPR